MKKVRSQRGQIALVVLLIMIVMLTLGISVAQRGLFDVRLSIQEEETSRAFQAAETGIEESLRTLISGGGTVGDVNYTSTVTAGGDSGITSKNPVAVGESLAINTAGAADFADRIEVYFISSSDCADEPAAIEVVRLREAGGNNVSVLRDVYDVENRGNGFDIVSTGTYSFLGETFCARTGQITIQNNVTEVRVRPFYFDAVIGVAPVSGGTLGNQFRLIRSEGKTGSGVVRTVEVQRGDAQVPTIFDYVLFSGNNLTK